MSTCHCDSLLRFCPIHGNPAHRRAVAEMTAHLDRCNLRLQEQTERIGAQNVRIGQLLNDVSIKDAELTKLRARTPQNLVALVDACRRALTEAGLPLYVADALDKLNGKT